MDDESGESMELMEEVPLEELGVRIGEISPPIHPTKVAAKKNIFL